MTNAKSFFPETNPQYIGIYWGSASSPGCREVVESSDAYLFAGPIFSDYTTVGFSALIQPARLVEASPERILVEGQAYHGIVLAEFLSGLAAKLTVNPISLDAYLRIKETIPLPPPATNGDRPLSTRRLLHHINESLDGTTTVVAETGDSWFNGMDLHLPDGCKFEIQMQYGYIGWSVGDFPGLAAAEDFIIDDETWTIRYLVVDTRNWWSGKKVLVSPQWIERVSWSESKIYVDLPLDAIKEAPEYTEEFFC